MKTRVALIGISGYGFVHFEHIRRLADKGIVELAAVVVINPDQVQKQLEILKHYNTKIYASTREMYADFSGKRAFTILPEQVFVKHRKRSVPDCFSAIFQKKQEKPGLPAEKS